MTTCNYKNTLNLPQTNFPMRANLPKREQEMLILWEKLDLYQKIREVCHGKKKFILHDGPPYANGRAHLGTAFNKILKDIVVKSKTLSGFDAPFVPGWDCHGLPIELNVEKQLGKISLSVNQFRRACRDYATSQIELQRKDFKRLGVLGDWNNPYLTMDFLYEANTVRSLSTIVENGHLIRKKKPVHWCIACGSALAEAEVEYYDKRSLSLDIAFCAIDHKDISRRFLINEINKKARIIVPIWTTTPWTLPANEAVSVHPDLLYVLVKSELHDQHIVVYWILVKDLIDSVMQRYRINNYIIYSSLKGNKLEGVILQHPFLNRNVPIILSEYVTNTVGTGNVHIAPAHGLEDYLVAEKYNLPINNLVDARGYFIESAFVGRSVFKSNKFITILLSDNRYLLHSKIIQHHYPHCWRHKTPLIFRSTPQWFISMDRNGLRKQALSEISKVKWIPTWGQNRIKKMLSDRPDWCISRQRLWGIPIPLFINKKSGALHPNTTYLIEKIAKIIEKEGSDAWFTLEKGTLLGKESERYEKVMDVLDVWYDSGITHFSVLAARSELRVPAELYLEGSDQHRGWFQSSLLTALAMQGRVPYNTVLTCGFIVDKKKRKMSKSLGNVVLPFDIVKILGADVLRLWVAAMDYTTEVNVSTEVLERISDTYRKIRNTARFLLSNLYDFNPKKDIVATEKLIALDRWAITTTQRFQKKIISAYNQYKFSIIYQLIHSFCTREMCSFYLDILKDRLYTGKKTGLPRRSAQTALYYITEAFVRWGAPIVSFTMDEMWKCIPGEREVSVFLSQWFLGFPEVALCSREDKEWKVLLQIRDEINKAMENYRNQNKIGSALSTEIFLYADKNLYPILKKLGNELRFVFITSGATVFPINSQPKVAIKTNLSGLALEIRVSPFKKCSRCWQHQVSVGQIKQYPALCNRCVSNAFGEGEERWFA